MATSDGLSAEQMAFLREILEEASRLGLARVEYAGMVFAFFPRVETREAQGPVDPWNEGE